MLQRCTSDTFQFSFAVFSQLFNLAKADFQLLVADSAYCVRTFQPAISRSDKRGYQGRMVPKHFGWFKNEDGSNVDNQLASATFTLPRSYGFQLLAAFALNMSKGSFTAGVSLMGRWLYDTPCKNVNSF